MDIHLPFLVLVLSCAVEAAPLSGKLNKRRHSTPEILGLEQQLKKAAGENKQFFSNSDEQPAAQVDGLDKENEELINSADGYTRGPVDLPEEQSNDLPQPGMDAPSGQDMLEDGADPDSYMEMWKLFRQHPQFMQDMFQEYQKNPDASLMGQGPADNLPPDVASQLASMKGSLNTDPQQADLAQQYALEGQQPVYQTGLQGQGAVDESDWLGMPDQQQTRHNTRAPEEEQLN